MNRRSFLKDSVFLTAAVAVAPQLAASCVPRTSTPDLRIARRFAYVPDTTGKSLEEIEAYWKKP